MPQGPTHTLRAIWAEREGDLAVSRRVDFPDVERPHKGDRLGNARVKLGDRLLVVLITRRVYAGERCACVLGQVAGAALALPSKTGFVCIIKYLAFFGKLLSKSKWLERHWVGGASCRSMMVRETQHAILAVAQCE
jgi:hypothetical protein